MRPQGCRRQPSHTQWVSWPATLETVATGRAFDTSTPADTWAGCTCSLVGRVMAYQGGKGSRQIVRRYTVCKFRQRWRCLACIGPTRDCRSRSALGSARTATPKTGTNARRGEVVRPSNDVCVETSSRRPSLRDTIVESVSIVSYLKQRSTSSGVGDFRAAQETVQHGAVSNHAVVASVPADLSRGRAGTRLSGVFSRQATLKGHLWPCGGPGARSASCRGFSKQPWVLKSLQRRRRTAE